MAPGTVQGSGVYVSVSGMAVVPYPVTRSGWRWGVVCLAHPHPADGPTDYRWSTAADYADALQCIECGTRD